MAATSAPCAQHFPLRVSRTRLYSSSSDCCPPSAGHNGSSDGAEKTAFGRRSVFLGRRVAFVGGRFGLILRFPPNFVRQLSNKARRNCSNIGVAQIVAASWSNDQPPFESSVSAASFAAAAVVLPEEEEVTESIKHDSDVLPSEDEAPNAVPTSAVSALFGSDQSLTVHAGERYGRGLVTDSITTPLVRTSAYWFKNSDELIDFKEGRYASYEYGRYGNPTTKSLEEKMSALERAESTLFVSSGMYASVALIMALVPAKGHIITTTDCYRKTRMFIEKELPKLGITVTIIDPADMNALKSALDQENVSLFFTESPTNPFLRCVDIELVSKLCHDRGTLVCIDGTFAPPVNQKALELGADLVIHSATKYIGGHNDVLGGCISGSDHLVSKIRLYHNVIGGVLNPDAAAMFVRGMKTLHLRVQEQNKTALRMAQVLEEHPKIVRVYYPGLPSHPEHHIAKRQMTGFGGVVSFEVKGDFHATKKFIDSLNIPYIAPSFGGVESIVDQPAIMSYWDSKEDRVKYGIKDNLVRFSFGIEAFEDLKVDIFQALEAI
ncbi:cystathionine gamma-synthase 1, chloroplastic [Dendrobium catenatum]|uniref:plant cystathionine gamma-synthase n=1 Tax=Dendrobium catenatum TaxID=906689 RepID=A0A2I0WQP7_9ASPA|nr:cystathionine gamma-synthase 1, chloroplastic [Dendrobium catenatum]XP_020675696.1 cystathionine gamma-synthase 1, chloroplastic [Dendrobium catenatum]PKU77976.1 Cystathionine gamma-synthase, chloroplastic [Dendrobium catenatum]